MTERRKRNCETIIHAAAAVSAAAGGSTVLPGSDAVVIMPVQVGMVLALAREFDVKLTAAVAKSAAYASFGQIIGKGASRLLGGAIPGVGNIVRAGVAFSLTQALGWAVVAQLEAGEFA